MDHNFPEGFLITPYEDKCTTDNFSSSSQVALPEGDHCTGPWIFERILKFQSGVGDEIHIVHRQDFDDENFFT